jgi:hypothetical protein
MFIKKMTKKRVGIVGIPPLEIVKEIEDDNYAIFDLDEPIVKKSIEVVSPFLPQVYCAILRTVMVNAISLDLEEIFIDVGPGKCDCALHTATILEKTLPKVTITRTRNQDNIDYGTPLCRTEMNLFEKMSQITGSVQSSKAHTELPACAPTAGFWGVPPRDFSLLNYFPPTTHVYGWARCMENKTPDNKELEEHFNPNVPTIFFAQSFCAKTALANHLSKQHPHALYLDCDVTAGSSAKAKIQAFLELSGVEYATR